ncbi:uncharacterized protein LOC142175737 [Nicotiana tabacum]|uniref:Uncharacterized protein LOC142175737 n=1 Tax=Nicotiana tabacum TaxID=4097 RepID=A0AC58TNM4_TOBAC
MGKPDRHRSNDIHSMGDWEDFNVVLQLQVRMHGNPGTMAETQDFSKCIQDLRLSELTWEGEYYTWSNKQDGYDRIWSRIDRIFSNYEWMMPRGHISTVYEMPFISDHAPMSLTFNDNQRSRKTSFKLFNVWVDYERFLTDVQQIWQQRFHRQKIQDVWMKLKALRPVLRKLNVEEFKFIRQKIEIARIELEKVQRSIDANCSVEMLLKENELVQNLEKWDMIEEGALKQKARAKWIQLGDSNTKYFSAVMKERSQRKQILELHSITGNRITDSESIKREIVEFYKSLMGAAAQSLPAIDKMVLHKGPKLNQQQRIELCKDVTPEEIYEGM